VQLALLGKKDDSITSPGLITLPQSTPPYPTPHLLAVASRQPCSDQHLFTCCHLIHQQASSCSSWAGQWASHLIRATLITSQSQAGS